MLNFGRDNTSKIAKWWRNIDKEILFLLVSLFLLGLFFSFSSTSSIVGEKMNKQTYFFFIKHLIFVFISLFLIILISIQEKEKLIKFLPYLFFISLVLLSLTIYGVEVKGSKRWIDLPFLPRFQPIELVKPLFIIYIAKIIMFDKKILIYRRYLYSFTLLLIITILLINQPDLGQTLLLTSTWITMIFLSGFNMFILSIIIMLFLVTFGFLILFFPEKFGYVFLRIKAFIDPKSGDNFQSEKALDAIKQGGLTGQGMGEGILKESVPEAHTDYIVAVIAEEFGAIFVIFIVIIFLLAGYKVLKKVLLEKDEFIKLALTGLVSLLILQAFIHIGVNIRLLPTTGMTLPFLSYGGSSLIGSGIISGIILNFSRKDSTRLFKNE